VLCAGAGNAECGRRLQLLHFRKTGGFAKTVEMWRSEMAEPKFDGFHRATKEEALALSPGDPVYTPYRELGYGAGGILQQVYVEEVAARPKSYCESGVWVVLRNRECPCCKRGILGQAELRGLDSYWIWLPNKDGERT